MATSATFNGFKRILDRSSNFASTDSTIGILVEGQEAMGFKKDSVGTYALTKIGTQNAEALASIIDGYGVSLATGYSASGCNRIYALEVNGDTGSTDCTGDTNLGAIKGRVVAGTTQTNCGISGIIGTLDVGTVSLQGNFNGVCGVLDFYGNCTLGSGASCYGAGLVAVVWNEATTTLGGGAVLSGVDIVENGAVGSFGASSRNPAINIRGNWNQALYATITPTTASAVMNLIVTDSATLSSGRGRGLYIQYTVSGAKTSSYGIRSVAVDTTISASCPSVYGASYWMSDLTTETVGFYCPMALYAGKCGSGVSSYVGLDIGMNANSAPSTRNAFIRCRAHQAVQAGGTVLLLEGNGTATYLLTYDSVAAQLSEGTDSANVTHKIAVRLNAISATRYIHLFSD